MEKIKLAIFDLDGVLTETSEQHYEAWKIIADELNIDFDKLFNEKLKGVSRMESLELILGNDSHPNQFTDEKKVNLTTKKNEIYKELIRNFTREQLFEGVIELFDDLKEKDIKIALASASKNATSLLKSMQVLERFDYIVDPSSVENGKPDPAIFLKAANKLGIEPDKCIGFEDAVAGVKAIKAAGMLAIGIGDSEVLYEADEVFVHIRKFNLNKFLKNM